MDFERETMSEWIKRLIGLKKPTTKKPKSSTEASVENPSEKPRRRKEKITKSEKDLATERNEPYIKILNIDLDETNIGNGSFELDWNDKFVANLVRAGYSGKTDQQIVDQWFQEICRNIVLESYEQEQADPEQRIQSSKKRLDDGRTEFS